VAKPKPEPVVKPKPELVAKPVAKVEKPKPRSERRPPWSWLGFGIVALVLAILVGLALFAGLFGLKGLAAQPAPTYTPYPTHTPYPIPPTSTMAPPESTPTSVPEPSAESLATEPPVFTSTTKPAAPDASAPTNSLKYDEMGCNADDLVACVPGEQAAWQADSANRHLFPAIYLRNVQSGDRSPSDAIVQIQQMASGWAKSWDKWTAFNADPRWPTLVWCPQRNCEYVPDTAFPLLNAPGVSSEWYYSIAIVSAHLPADPSASQTQVVCPSGDCWAVLLH
jgi:hypothetical protein